MLMLLLCLIAFLNLALSAPAGSSHMSELASRHRRSGEVTSLPYLDDYAPYVPCNYYHPYENTWHSYQDVSHGEANERFTTSTWQDRSHLYDSPDTRQMKWLDYLSDAETEALIERMAMLWKTQLSPAGRREVESRIGRQLSLMEADVVMKEKLTSRAVRDIIRRTEEQYEDPDFDSIAHQVLMQSGLCKSEVDKYVYKVLRNDGVRGQDVNSIANHVLERIKEPRVGLRTRNHARVKEIRRSHNQ